MLAPCWTSLVVRRVVGRFSYSPRAGHFLSSFGAWRGDSLTRPRLDISRRRSAHGAVARRGSCLVLQVGHIGSWTHRAVETSGHGHRAVAIQVASFILDTSGHGHRVLDTSGHGDIWPWTHRVMETSGHGPSGSWTSGRGYTSGIHNLSGHIGS